MLKLLVLAPGRSGTTSMRTLIEGLCRANGCDWTIQHQTQQAEITQATQLALLQGQTDPARQIYRSWTHEVEVSGNNNAFLIPVIREVFGDDLKIIRLERERESHVKSMLSGVASSPEVWGGYHDRHSEYTGPVYWHSPIAPWLGEMSQMDWDSLSTEQRLRWYIETMQTLMDEGAKTFKDRLHVKTEDLDAPATVQRIAQFINSSWTKLIPSVHQNRRAMYDFSKLTPEQAAEAKRVFGKFDFNRVLQDSNYMLEWSFEKALEVSPDPHALLTAIEEVARSIRTELGAHPGAPASQRS